MAFPLYYRYSNSDKSHRPRKIGERTSRYNFEVTGPKQDVSVNNSYRKFSEIRIIDSNTGKVVAKATEHIFGGGIAGTYMRYFGHGNWSPDDIYLACGYAQNTPHSYRPNGGEREKVKIRQLYINADREFITRTLTPKSDKNRVEP